MVCPRLGLFLKVQRHVQKRTITNTVGFIGLGNMGSRIATNLVKHGRKLKVYDVSPSAAQNLSGVQICNSPEEAATNAAVIITMLPDGAAVRNVVLGTKGILKSITKNSLLIDCSTIEPNVAQELHEKSKESQVRFVDAPVSGGIKGAEAGTLTFMVGGAEEDIRAAEPFLMQAGSKILHCGGPGAGQAAKLCNNLILAVSMAATAEAMNLGEKLGLNLTTLTQVVNSSSGRCWSSELYNPVPGIVPNVPSGNNYEGGFACKLMAKDLALAANSALSCGAPTPLGALVHQLYRTMLVHGYAQKDFSVIYKFLQGK